jgi:hypothetical protein
MNDSAWGMAHNPRLATGRTADQGQVEKAALTQGPPRGALGQDYNP